MVSRRIAVVLAGLLVCLVALALPAAAKDKTTDAGSTTPVVASSPGTGGDGSDVPTSGDTSPAGGKGGSGGATKDKPTSSTTSTKPSAAPSVAAPSAAPEVTTPNRTTQSSAPSTTTSRSDSSSSTDRPQATAAPAPVSTGASTTLPAPNPMLLPESATYAAPVDHERPSALSGLFPFLLIGAALISLAVGGVILRKRGLLHR